MNLVKIATACAVECERQQVGLAELGYLIRAYRYVVNVGEQSFDSLGFQILAKMIEPDKNGGGFRIKPVTFANGGSSANSQEIPRLMQSHVEVIDHFNNGLLNFMPREKIVAQVVKEFLWIHPFADGNGRLAWLLLNYLLGTLDDPVPLPDFGW